MANGLPEGAGGGMAALFGINPGGDGAGAGGQPPELVLPPLPGSEGGAAAGAAAAGSKEGGSENGGSGQKAGVAGSANEPPVHLYRGRHGNLTQQELDERLDRQLMHDDYSRKTTGHSEAVKQFTTQKEAFQQQMQEVAPLLEAVRKLPPEIQGQLLKGDYSTISRANETDARLAEHLAGLPPDDPSRLAHTRASTLEKLMAEKSQQVEQMKGNLESMAEVMFNLATDRDLDLVQRDFEARGVQFDRAAVRKAIDESGEPYSGNLVTTVAKSMHEQAMLAAAVERGRQEALKQQGALKKDALPAPGSGTGAPQSVVKTEKERFAEAGQILDNLYSGML